MIINISKVKIQTYLSIIIVSLTACTNLSEKNNDNNTRVTAYKIPENATPIVYNGYVIVPSTIDSVQGNFLIDTGAGELLLDSIFHYSNNTKILKYQTFFISGIGNSRIEISVIMDSVNFSVKNLNYRTSDVPIINMKPIGGDIIDGGIGTDFLTKSVLEINYVKEYINIYKDIDSVDISEYNVIPMKIIDIQYCIPLTIKINDAVTIKGYFMIDTGSPTTTLTSSVVKNNNLEKNIVHKARYYSNYGGIGGASSGYDFFADSLIISNYNLSNVIMSFSSDTSGLLADDKYMGIVGNDFLEHFDILFDFTNNNLHLKPNEKFKDPFIPDRLGFFYVDRIKTMGGWIVTGLFENSSAEKEGLKIDDIIISMNGIPVEKISYKDKMKKYNNLDNVKLVIKNNEGIKNIELKLSPLL